VIARAMEEMKLEVDQLAARWTVAGQIVIPDTNVLLHHVAPFDEIDWADELDVRNAPVHVVLPLVVVYELDKNKTNTKRLDDGTLVKTRARKTLNRIDELIPTEQPTKRAVLSEASNAVGYAATLDVLVDPLDHVPLNNADNEIVDRAGFLQQISKSPLKIVTGDSTMRLLAATNGLQVAYLKGDQE
jgi:predicted ribonuclease YlaK